MSTEAPPLTPEQEATYHENRGALVTIPIAVFIGLHTVAVVLRFVSRISRRTKLGADDYFAAGALVVATAYCAVVIASVGVGMGRHTWAVDPSGAWKIIRFGYILAIINPVARVFIKLSLLFLYHRVFTMNFRWFKWCWWTLLCFIVAHAISGCLASVWQCIPPSHFWERFDPAKNSDGYCGVQAPKLLVASGALAIFAEVCLFFLPIAMLWQLQLKLAQKIGFIIIFGTGAFAIAAECTRLRFAMTANELHADTTWITADIYLWVGLELSVGLICACLPTFGPIVVGIKTIVSSYILEISLLRSAGSDRKNSADGKQTSSARWRPTISVARRRPGSSSSTTQLEPTADQDPHGILRTDEFRLDTYPRGDEASLHDYHDPTKTRSGYHFEERN